MTANDETLKPQKETLLKQCGFNVPSLCQILVQVGLMSRQVACVATISSFPRDWIILMSPDITSGPWSIKAADASNAVEKSVL